MASWRAIEKFIEITNNLAWVLELPVDVFPVDGGYELVLWNITHDGCYELKREWVMYRGSMEKLLHLWKQEVAWLEFMECS